MMMMFPGGIRDVSKLIDKHYMPQAVAKSIGWKLMPREYTTLKSLLATAKKNKMDIIEL